MFLECFYMRSNLLHKHPHLLTIYQFLKGTEINLMIWKGLSLEVGADYCTITN